MIWEVAQWTESTLSIFNQKIICGDGDHLFIPHTHSMMMFIMFHMSPILSFAELV